MPSQGNTYVIMQAIQTKCQGLQVSSSTFFQSANVVIAKLKDVTNNIPSCEITMADDEAARYTAGGGPTLGGKIDDSQHFLIELTLDMTDSVGVEQQLANIRDSLSAAFMQSATLATTNVAYSGWDGKGTDGYSIRNGVYWRCYRRFLKVRFEYAVIMQQ